MTMVSDTPVIFERTIEANQVQRPLWLNVLRHGVLNHSRNAPLAVGLLVVTHTWHVTKSICRVSKDTALVDMSPLHA